MPSSSRKKPLALRHVAQVDFQRCSGNSSTIGVTCNLTRDFQVNPAIYVTSDSPHRVLGYVVFTYTFHLWREKEKRAVQGNEK